MKWMITIILLFGCNASKPLFKGSSEPKIDKIVNNIYIKGDSNMVIINYHFNSYDTLKRDSL